jgi:L-ascorbate metabolism protein UlaG (beta-lactamase superfamily)
MRVTKKEHAALLLEIDGQTLIVDPGAFTSPLTDVENVVAIVVTHEHADHWTDDQLAGILEHNPAAPIFAPEGVAIAASKFEITVVEAGDTQTVGPFTLKFFGDTHAVIHESMPVIDNVGVLVNDTFYYPGDSYTVPDGAQVELLAAPVGAPWLKIGDAMDFVLAVKAKRVFATHDETLSGPGKGIGSDRLGWAAKEAGGEFVAVTPGESIEV